MHMSLSWISMKGGEKEEEGCMLRMWFMLDISNFLSLYETLTSA